MSKRATTIANVRMLLSQERHDLATLLGSLSESDWEIESLCAGWRIRDVVAHLLNETTSLAHYAYETVRVGGSTAKFNELYIRRGSSLSTAQLVERFESTIDRGVGYTFAPTIALADLLIHHQDIRRPLGRPRDIPVERLSMVLRHPDPFIRPGRRMRGLRFVATDIAYTHGDGPEVRGPGEAIIMAIAGRAAALEQLDGPGVAILRDRQG
ncbi:maleylpyruvate isomerase family mycothiol-dependent enzyme [Nocardia sp. NPDC050406]|uniref:maleylpyruvate isomerase family mycothiol-dependent enzyme n=1 Tax=Nocardia sp. NPDC050406 TaxID=3364318 RepID=UPI0037B04A5D